KDCWLVARHPTHREQICSSTLPGALGPIAKGYSRVSQLSLELDISGQSYASEEVGWPVLGYLLGKNYRRRDRDRLVPPRWMDAAVYPYRGVLSFPSKAREASGSETARLHHAHRRRGGGLAARGARAARRARATYWRANALPRE